MDSAARMPSARSRNSPTSAVHSCPGGRRSAMSARISSATLTLSFRDRFTRCVVRSAATEITTRTLATRTQLIEHGVPSCIPSNAKCISAPNSLMRWADTLFFVFIFFLLFNELQTRCGQKSGSLWAVPHFMDCSLLQQPPV